MIEDNTLKFYGYQIEEEKKKPLHSTAQLIKEVHSTVQQSYSKRHLQETENLNDNISF